VELEKALQPGREMKMDSSLKPGAAGVIDTNAKNNKSQSAPKTASQPAGPNLNEQADDTPCCVTSSARTTPFGSWAKQVRGSSSAIASPTQGQQNATRVSQPSPSSARQDVAKEEGEAALTITREEMAPSVARFPTRPPSRSNLSGSSRASTGTLRHPGSPRMIKQVADDWDALDTSLHRTSRATQQAAAVYACGPGARVALKYSARAGSPRSMLFDEDARSPQHHSMPPARLGTSHGLPQWERLGGGGNSSARLTRAIASRAELEAALSSAQTAVVMAMERESALAAENQKKNL